MVLQDAPAAFDRVVLAVVRRLIGETYGDPILLDESDEPLHKLGAPTMILWPVIHIDDQRRDVGNPFSHGLPPLHQPVYKAITGHLRCDPIDKQFVQRWEKYADGGEGCRWVKVVVDRCDVGTRLAPPREGADFDGGFGIHGEA